MTGPELAFMLTLSFFIGCIIGFFVALDQERNRRRAARNRSKAND